MALSNYSTDFSGLLDKQQIDTLSILYTVLLSFSVTGSCSVLLVSAVRWRYLRGQVQLLVQLALADLLAAVILLYTSVMNKVYPYSSVTACPYLLPLSLTFYFISFLLVVVYAWKSKNAIQGWRERAADDDEHCQCEGNIITIPMYALVWLVPFAVYFAYVCTLLIKLAALVPTNDVSQDGLNEDGSSYCNSCILFLHLWQDPCADADAKHNTIIRVFLVITAITVMLSCSVIYCKVRKWYERYMHDGLFPVEGDGNSRRQLRTVFSTARNIIMVIMFCWLPALLLLLMSLTIRTYVKQNSLYGLYLMQAVTVSLQGFLNSMVYAWSRPNFTNAVLGKTPPAEI